MPPTPFPTPAIQVTAIVDGNDFSVDLSKHAASTQRYLPRPVSLRETLSALFKIPLYAANVPPIQPDRVHKVRNIHAHCFAGDGHTRGLHLSACDSTAMRDVGCECCNLLSQVVERLCAWIGEIQRARVVRCI